MLPTSIAGSIAIVPPPGADVAGLDRAQVHLLEGEVAARLHPAQVGVGLVGAGDVGVAVDRRVLDHRQLGADRAEEAGRAELGGDLVLARLAEGRAERVAQLDLVEAVVAADEDEDHPALLDDHRQRLEEGAGRQPEVGGDLVDLGQARRLDLLRARAAAAAAATGCASALATSTLAA